jgi:hypothetical protein
MTMTAFQSAPIYVSERSAKNMWQEYRVYPEAVELRARLLFTTFVITAEDILDVKVVPGGFFWGLFHAAELSFWFAVKLDWADVCEHVWLHRKSGRMKNIRFTPDNPERFVAACRSIMK